MNRFIAIIFVLSCNMVYADSSVKGFYGVNVKLKSGEDVSGFVWLIDSNKTLAPITITGHKLEYEFGNYIRLFKKPVIELKHPAKQFLISKNIDEFTRADIDSTFFIADAKEIDNIAISNVTGITINSSVDKLETQGEIYSQNEILAVQGNDMYLLTRGKPLTFMLYETALNRRIYVFSYGNNGVSSRADLYRYLNKRGQEFDPKLINKPTVLSEGIYAIPVEYEAEAI